MRANCEHRSRPRKRMFVVFHNSRSPSALRTLRTINATLWRLLPRPDGVVPFGMERIADDVEAFHLGLADLDPLFIGARVERTLDLQPGLGRCRPDQFDDGEAIGQRPATPVLGNRTEQPVLDLIPLCAAET